MGYGDFVADALPALIVLAVAAVYLVAYAWSVRQRSTPDLIAALDREPRMAPSLARSAASPGRKMAEKFEGMGLGWLPDYPDFRDHTTEEAKVSARRKLVGEEVPIKGMLGALNVADRKAPAKVDLRPWCSAVENQGSIGSCTAHAGVGVVEYFERRVLEGTSMRRVSSSTRSRET